jgi:hypothetical protein
VKTAHPPRFTIKACFGRVFHPQIGSLSVGDNRFKGSVAILGSRRKLRRGCHRNILRRYGHLFGSCFWWNGWRILTEYYSYLEHSKSELRTPGSPSLVWRRIAKPEDPGVEIRWALGPRGFKSHSRRQESSETRLPLDKDLNCQMP